MVKVFPKTSTRNRPTNKLIPFSFYNRASITYRKLPQQHLLKLHVLKLDGSSFSIHVARNTTVAGLKFAVEEEFSLFPQDDRARLWALVWSHFCLCYDGQKLIHDVACIQKYGIKDGDQVIASRNGNIQYLKFFVRKQEREAYLSSCNRKDLRFIQHLRIDLSPTPKQSKDPRFKFKQGSMTDHQNKEDESEDARYFQLALREPRFRLTSSLKGLLSCSRF